MRQYRALCQKNQEENYLLDKYFFRHISILFTVLLIQLKVRPNQATFFSLLASLTSLYFLAVGSQRSLLAAAVFIFLYYLLDHVDGELARYYIHQGEKSSLSGHYFDVLVHRYSSNLMVFFLGVGLYQGYGYQWTILLGFFSCIGLSSLPNVISAQVIAGKMAQEREIVYNRSIKRLLPHFQRRRQQIHIIQKSGFFERLKKLITEILFFPGHILLFILVLCGDYFFHDFFILSFPCNFRLLFLLGMSLLYTFKTMAQSLLWLKRFRRADIP